jgi:pyruvate/2-oxoglutarate dehydrogenase complex dihydrolipoamide acyltransferase (E2) component
MGHSYRATDGTAFRHTPSRLGLGLAVDVERKDGSRGLVVPVIKGADTLDFAAFHTAYEGLVAKARGNKLMPDDFAGGSMTLTNPGGLGTSMSVPRLMAGQGSIIATGAIAYPPEFSGVSKERIADLGIAKIMTVTSTYDHRSFKEQSRENSWGAGSVLGGDGSSWGSREPEGSRVQRPTNRLTDRLTKPTDTRQHAPASLAHARGHIPGR